VIQPKLGVNIDHIATLRQLRGTPYPDLLEASFLCAEGGADQITIHLREDRRHIQDEDVFLLRHQAPLPLNLEISIAPEIVRIARKVAPPWICLVPEKRKELTTEGGLNLADQAKKIEKTIRDLQKEGSKVSLFIEPQPRTIALAQSLGADAVEIHTGKYCNATQGAYGKRSDTSAKKEFQRILDAGLNAARRGLHAHVGHGFDLKNVRPVVKGGNFEEYNIGHSIVCRAALVGLTRAVREMVSAIRAP
jgi:pyridoxine 5-phosphate synthase